MLLCAPRNISVEEWARIVWGEYDESPGLSLTRPQVRRLWNLEPDLCDAVLEHLTKTGYLRQNARNMYVRDDDWR
jgi:hypothetical protein